MSHITSINRPRASLIHYKQHHWEFSYTVLRNSSFPILLSLLFAIAFGLAPDPLSLLLNRYLGIKQPEHEAGLTDCQEWTQWLMQVNTLITNFNSLYSITSAWFMGTVNDHHYAINLTHPSAHNFRPSDHFNRVLRTWTVLLKGHTGLNTYPSYIICDKIILYECQ